MPSSEYRKILIYQLATNLQVIRSKLPAGCYMKITSGVRTLADYERLKKAGYKPSKTSDHNCGLAIPLSPSSSRFKKYGSTYNFAVGAADVVPVGLTVWGLFALSVDFVKKKKCNFGQVIYEKNPKTGAEWVHYGNSLKGIFSKKIIDFVGRKQFMKSLDGGRTYSVVNKV